MKKICFYNGKRIHYQINGRGKSLVLIHGYLESLHMWKAHQEALASNYQVISIDLPGHGKTDHFYDVHTMSFLSDIIYAVLKSENIEKCVMIGHSMGGYATLEFASKYPTLLSGFGLFHSHARADDAESKQNRARTIDLINQDKGHFIYHFIPTLFAAENVSKFSKQIDNQIELANAMDKKTVIAAMEGIKERESMLQVLIETKVPVLFILGKKDSRIPLEMALAQTALPPNAMVLILGKSGHMGWLEEQEKTIATIDGFIKVCFSA
ncbi:MAG: alpha/beta hydrolase [Bacteroidota bacterium]